VADFYWITAALIGAVLGALTMLLLFLALDHGRLDLNSYRNPEALKVIAGLFADAGLIAGAAFAVYCRLVRVALRKLEMKSGAPKGTPRSIPWFEI